MCATEEDLKQQAYYDPTGTMQWKGPVGECKMESFPLDRNIGGKLWEVSEQVTGANWTF